MKFNIIISFLFMKEPYALYGEATTAFDFSNADTREECCNICRNERDNCAAFSYLQKEKMCYIFNTLNSPVQTPYVVGGQPY